MIPNEAWLVASVGIGLLVLFGLTIVGRRFGPGAPARTMEDLRSTQEFKNVNDRLAALEKGQEKTQHDINNIRMVLTGLPTKDQVHKVELEIAKVSGEVRGAVEVGRSTAIAVGRIENFLMAATSEAIVRRAVEGRPENGHGTSQENAKS